MKNKKEIRDELESLSPFLSANKKEPEGYQVPKDYFKTLPDEVFKKLNIAPQPVITEKENWSTRFFNSLQYFFQPRLALAYATVALLIFAGLFFTKNENETTPPKMMADAILNEVPDEVLTEYIAANIDHFDETILAEQLTGNSENPLLILELENDEELIDDLMEELDTEEIETLF